MIRNVDDSLSVMLTFMMPVVFVDGWAAGVELLSWVSLGVGGVEDEVPRSSREKMGDFTMCVEVGLTGGKCFWPITADSSCPATGLAQKAT